MKIKQKEVLLYVSRTIIMIRPRHVKPRIILGFQKPSPTDAPAEAQVYETLTLLKCSLLSSVSSGPAWGQVALVILSKALLPGGDCFCAQSPIRLVSDMVLASLTPGAVSECPPGSSLLSWTEHSPSLICPSYLRVASLPF